MPGFVQFALLKGDEPGDYVSHTIWVNREAFIAWAQSDAFRAAHSMALPEGRLNVAATRRTGISAST